MTTQPGSYVMAMAGSGHTFVCRADQPLLTAMIAAGHTGIKVGCRSGGCGVCRIRVMAGRYAGQKMSRARISEADEAAGIVLACRITPGSDLAFEPLPPPCFTRQSRSPAA